MTTPPNISWYDLGDLVRVSATIIGTDGVTGVMPSSFYFLVRNPLGTVGTYQYGAGGASIQALASYVFAKDLSADYAGTWYYRAMATGVGQGAEEWLFFVASSSVI